jgi:hypothetical protein
MGLLFRIGVPCSSSIGRAAQRFDPRVLQRFPRARSLAFAFVLKAWKESWEEPRFYFG